MLSEIGYQASSLGCNIPLSSIAQAVEDQKPRIVWISVSNIEDKDQFLKRYAGFYERAEQHSAVVVGGRALTKSIRSKMQFATCCENMQELANFATALRNDTPTKPTEASAN